MQFTINSLSDERLLKIGNKIDNCSFHSLNPKKYAILNMFYTYFWEHKKPKSKVF